MISVNRLTKSYGERDLFKDVSASINAGEKIGLVGPNGAGKSTFISILLGTSEATSGYVQVNKNIRIGYLPQETNFQTTATVLSEVLEGDVQIMELLKEKKALEIAHKAGAPRYGEVLHDLEFLGYFNLEHKAKKVLMGLGFKEADFTRSVKEMSGGWQMRVLLAKLLTCSYDVLFLDEPMNHLDLGAALWFKDYLLQFNGTFVLISHDKDFLTQVTNHTLILDNGEIVKIKGGYEDYEKLNSERRAHLLKQFNEQEKKRQQLLDFMYRFHAQPNKASQVRAKKRMIEKMEKIVVPKDRKESIRNFKFPPAKRSGYRIISLSGISKSYGAIEVYKNFNFEIEKGEKAVLVGENGAGKSTLLKILAGTIDIDEGQRTVGHNVDVGYFSQTRMDVLTADNTVFDEAYSVSAGKIRGEDIRTILAAFFFIGDDVEKKVKVLSGGEKSRLILAKLLIDPPNLLLLDEPTTHLDVDAVDALIVALEKYTGAIVFISHDIHFVRSVANTVYEVKSGSVVKYSGNFDYYWERIKSKDSAASDVSGQNHSKKVKTDSTKPKGQAFLDHKAQKKRKSTNAKLAKQIHALRKEKEDLELDRSVKHRVLSNPRSYHNKERVVEYGKILKEIESRLSAIDKEIIELKDSFI
jgi:ATP-binding cassette, subfamily F, member 3